MPERQGLDNAPEVTAHQTGRCLSVTENFLKITAPAEGRHGLSQVFILISVPRMSIHFSKQKWHSVYVLFQPWPLPIWPLEIKPQNSSIPMMMGRTVWVCSHLMKTVKEKQAGFWRPCGRGPWVCALTRFQINARLLWS